MKKFHFNPDSGETGECTAEEGNCPFGEIIIKHYSSKREASKAYENYIREHKIFETFYNDTPEDLRELPIKSIINKPLKELNALQLSQRVQHESVKKGLDYEKVMSAINLASVLHQHQTRGNRGNFPKTPYIEHPLRNAARVLRWGSKDEDVIIAALLHDTIEDGAKQFVSKILKKSSRIDELKAREHLKNHIKKAYNERVLKLVESVTNDYITDNEKKDITQEQKMATYLEHVSTNIKKSPGVFLVKLSDFADNAFGLHHNNVPGREKKTYNQARKYLAVVDIFRKELNSGNIPLNKNITKRIKDQLDETEVRLSSIIYNYEKTLSKI